MSTFLLVTKLELHQGVVWGAELKVREDYSYNNTKSKTFLK